MVTLSLESFVSRCDGGQSEAASRIGCNQTNICRHLKEIALGTKQVLVSLDGETVEEVAIIKGLNKRPLSMKYLPVSEVTNNAS
ncbi:MAG: hypothetical protein OXE99_08095 [Cellvibrionales bacterium]|nr:hypothetical protein [Cellvibrionales bacterium]